MGKMRIYEYAKKNNVTSKEVIDQLIKMNIEVSNHMSSITAETRYELDKTFNKSKQTENKQEKQKVGTNNSTPANKQNSDKKQNNQSKQKHQPKQKAKQHKKNQKNKKTKKN